MEPGVRVSLPGGAGRAGCCRAGVVGSSRSMTASGTCGGRILPQSQVDPGRKLLGTDGLHHVVHSAAALATEDITLMSPGFCQITGTDCKAGSPLSLRTVQTR